MEKDETDTSWVVPKAKEMQSRHPTLTLAEVAVGMLAEVIKQSKASTMQGLGAELKAATRHLSTLANSFALESACENYIRFVTRSSSDTPDTYKLHAIERGERFYEITELCRQRIAKLGLRFIRDGARILAHGFSRCVLAVLLAAAAEKKRLFVFITESHPNATGYDLQKELQYDDRIQVTMISDTAVASIMHKIDLIFLGAEAVVENGGIINKIGSYGISIIAKEMTKPLYVAAESYKFTRFYPLSQSDFASEHHDYTPPSYITLLITDLGVLMPSAVSDELIKLDF
jgi:translation initiation factor eIF-2B subunit alpha